MYSKGFEILQQTSYSEQAQKQIWSQIQAIQNLPDLINVNFKIIKISGQLYLQMKGELINIGPQSIMFDLYFQIQYKMVQDVKL
ncbi:unnamed protein product [Paramecium sonneborni]|uniref:Uncharacterized protein n=1 Tax=Paramecium sonneborni TaxID=65129 RepID=A0A8S1KG81_9CILI|nr:unnamed protein product [Paramecium sonneborni]